MKTEGKAKGGSARAPVRPRTSSAAFASAKSKPRTILVGKAKTKIPAGKTRPIKLKVTRQGAALIKARGSIKLTVTAKISIPGQKKVTKRKVVRVYLAKKK